MKWGQREAVLTGARSSRTWCGKATRISKGEQMRLADAPDQSTHRQKIGFQMVRDRTRRPPESGWKGRLSWAVRCPPGVCQADRQDDQEPSVGHHRCCCPEGGQRSRGGHQQQGPDGQDSQPRVSEQAVVRQRGLLPPRRDGPQSRARQTINLSTRSGQEPSRIGAIPDSMAWNSGVK